MQSKRTFFVRIFFVMFATLMIIFANGFTSVKAYAEDGIPENAPVFQGDESGGNADADKPAKPNANDVFGDVTVTQDSTGLSDEVGGFLSVVCSFIMKCVIYAFGVFLPLHFAVDALIMAFPIAGTFFATKVPFQLFSNEAGKLAGIKFVGNKSGDKNGGVGSAEASGGVGGGGDKNNTFFAKIKVYISERGLTVLVCSLLLVATYTGLLTWLVNSAVNSVIGLFYR